MLIHSEQNKSHNLISDFSFIKFSLIKLKSGDFIGGFFPFHSRASAELHKALISRTNRNDPWLHTRATKGHFCSLLISNIFCYPLFPNLPFAVSQHISKHPNLHSLRRIPLVFMRIGLQKVNLLGISFPRMSGFLRLNLSHICTKNLYQRVTPPCFTLHTLVQTLVNLIAAITVNREFTLPLASYFLSKFYTVNSKLNISLE